MQEKLWCGLDKNWWAVTSIHESAHAMVAFALGCHPVELALDRRAANKGSTRAGVCIARYEKSYYGDIAKLLATNAPFAAHQYECLPCGEKGDLHERDECQREFAEAIGGWNADLFSKCIDAPLLAFFGNSDIQGATIVLARILFEKSKVSLKKIAEWKKSLDIPDEPCEHLMKSCLAVAKAVSGQ